MILFNVNSVFIDENVKGKEKRNRETKLGGRWDAFCPTFNCKVMIMGRSVCDAEICTKEVYANVCR